MRRALLAAAVLTALLVAPAATAKELQAVVLCGASSCVRVDDPTTLREIPQGGETEEPLGRPSTFFRVTFVHGEPPNTTREPFYYLPGQNALAFVDRYGTVRALPIFGPSATNVMRRLTRDLTPFRPSAIVEVRVGGRTLRGEGAAAYADLFRAGARAPVTYPDDWVPVDLRSATPSPWTEGEREFMLSPEAALLERGGVQYKLQDELASDVAAARAIGSSSGRGWPPFAAVVLLVVAAGALVAHTRRREGAARAAPSRAAHVR